MTIGVGFGTAALGGNSYQVVQMALEAGFRKFDTAEADGWYDQKSVGMALHEYFKNSNIGDYMMEVEEDECMADGNTCSSGRPTSSSCQDLRVSTKIPPWSLTSADDIRAHARNSRKELVGFCGIENEDNKFPLDVYYIHAPQCWKGWHPKCDHPPPILPLQDACQAMEAVVGMDHSSRRIGLSNVHPQELKALIQNVQQRQRDWEQSYSTKTFSNPHVARPRIPDVLQAFADPLQPAEELRQICQSYGIEFVSYSTLGTQHRNSGGNNPVLTSPTVRRLAAKHGRSVAEVVLSWALQNGMSVIPRSTRKDHIQELARLLKEDPTFLDQDDLQDMDSMKQTFS